MSTEAFQTWLSEHSGTHWRWYVKRLAANDTLATKAHQAGPYFPKDVVFDLFATLKASNTPNPRVRLPVYLDSHGEPRRDVSVIWYNQGTRDECRITGWGGAQSPLLDPDATGSIAVFAFACGPEQEAAGCHVWLCSYAEEEAFEIQHETIDPGSPIYIVDGHNRLGQNTESAERPCWLTDATIPSNWKHAFPSGADIVRHTVGLRKLSGKTPDQRLLVRRACEFEIFRSIEQYLVLPRVKEGFESVDEFIEYSNAVNNRRKSRSGRSLELHVAEILIEEGIQFSHGEVSEGNKKPDFLIPSAKAYRSGVKPVWMLACKTTCKDRWRQIINEANAIPEKHLITLQEGISENQFSEMKAEGVSLVVPKSLHKSYPTSVREDLLTLEGFIAQINSASS